MNQTHLAAALFGALVAGLTMEACRYDAVEQAKARAIEACAKSIVYDVRPDNICKEILFRPKSHLTARFR